MDCKRLESLPKLPYLLGFVDASGCKRLKTVSGFTTALTEGSDQRYPFVLHIFNNSVSLDENARRNILDDAHLRNIAIAYYPRFSYEVRCQGIEIPKWVGNQMEGSSIDITLPLHWSEDPNFLGLAFCLLVDFRNAPNATCEAESIFKTENGESHTYHFSNNQSYSTRCDDDSPDHLVVVWYDSLQKVRSTPYTGATQASFHFHSFQKVWTKMKLHREKLEDRVKRCGVGFVYAQGQD
ncbi:hypothetical protein RchiOBHm_Chr5g0013931 [Rosa chinensis]|uniref:C-JID domain-containing protein n=1 Tax=Rosa chinensis TaxID=74649 RepID=A0A2P6Q5J0_ROSCH|nr:hypothetical protein RchiOBHm_Chr5g0013931 [Rosa chinensis]